VLRCADFLLGVLKSLEADSFSEIGFLLGVWLILGLLFGIISFFSSSSNQSEPGPNSINISTTYY